MPYETIVLWVSMQSQTFSFAMYTNPILQKEYIHEMGAHCKTIHYSIKIFINKFSIIDNYFMIIMRAHQIVQYINTRHSIYIILHIAQARSQRTGWAPKYNKRSERNVSTSKLLNMSWHRGATHCPRSCDTNSLLSYTYTFARNSFQ